MFISAINKTKVTEKIVLLKVEFTKKIKVLRRNMKGERFRLSRFLLCSRVIVVVVITPDHF